MKRSLRTLLIAALCTSTLVAGAYAAPKNTPQTKPGKESFQMMYGSWACVNGNMKNTTVYKSLWSGKGMLIDEGGKGQGQDMVTFDSKRGVYVDEYMDGMGEYSVMEGKPSGKTISFVQVYPSGGDAKFTVVSSSPKTFYSDFSMTYKGKVQKEHMSCKKQ